MVRLRIRQASAGSGYGCRSCTPTMDTVPPVRTASSASLIEVSVPTASMTASTPRPPVASRMDCAPGGATGTAPAACARSRRVCTGSTAYTVAAPRVSALRSAHMPTAPRPTIATDPPNGISARFAAAQPVARLSVSSSACSVLIPSGNASSWKSAAGTASSSDCAPPSTPEPKICGPCTQRIGSRVAQPAHRPQPATEDTSTRSPTLKPTTWEPVSTIVPIASCPRATGSKRG